MITAKCKNSSHFCRSMVL